MTTSTFTSRTTTLTAAALSLSLLAGVAQANDRYITQVGYQLATITHLANQQGLTLSDATGDRLYTNEVHQHRLSLAAGRPHLIVGSCDEDCRDMDLLLYNASGQLVARDTARDDHPMVAVPPDQSGTFTLVVAIPDCQARRCTYGMAVLTR